MKSFREKDTIILQETAAKVKAFFAKFTKKTRFLRLRPPDASDRPFSSLQSDEQIGIIHMYIYLQWRPAGIRPPASYLKSGGRRLLWGGRAAPGWPESFRSQAA